RALAMARFPGSPSSLDALCRRFGVDNSARTKHGALLDSEILAEVYLELVGGRQPGFGLAPVQDKARQPGAAPQTPRARPRPLAPRFTPAEAEAHAAFVAAMGADALWRRG
ncbi:MAG: DNA polymerase III subunit epsilon, partial [Gemmobacter sp.]